MLRRIGERENLRIFVACLLLMGLCGLAFSGALDCGFVRFDDHGYVYENPMVSAGLTRAGVQWAFTTKYMFNWHPLTWLSHMADVELYGLEPAGHHLTSLLLHGLNVLLLFFALRRLTGRFYPSLLAAALWAVHPLRVESVVWISERKDLLSSFFCLAALWVYGSKRGRHRMAWMALLFALALMAKPSWVTFPFLLLLLDAWPLRRWPEMTAWALVREKAPLFLLSALSCVITYSVQHSGGAVLSLETIPFFSRMANAVMAYGAYLRMLVWPVDLAVFYPYPVIAVPLWILAGSGIALLGLTVLAIRAVRQQPWGLMGWLWFLGSLVPMIGFIQAGGQAWADRYTYLPHIGLIVALVWSGRASVRHSGNVYIRRASLSVAFAVILALALLSRQQTATWRDSETLFLNALERTENNANIQFNLANLYQLSGRRDEACVHYRETLKIMPDDISVMNNLAYSLVSSKTVTPEEAKEALALATHAIERSRSRSVSLLNTLERAQAACGDYPAAVETARKVLELAESAGNTELRNKIYWRIGYYEIQEAAAKEKK